MNSDFQTEVEIRFEFARATCLFIVVFFFLPDTYGICLDIIVGWGFYEKAIFVQPTSGQLLCFKNLPPLFGTLICPEKVSFPGHIVYLASNCPVSSNTSSSALYVIGSEKRDHFGKDIAS